MTSTTIASERAADMDRLRDGLEDVTATLADINPGDVVYHDTATGRFVKVRTALAPEGQTLTRAIYHITGADCDAAGKALPFAVGHRIAPPLVVVIEARGGAALPLNIPADLERARLMAARSAVAMGLMNDQREAQEATKC
jgi:hypothetical protein